MSGCAEAADYETKEKKNKIKDYGTDNHVE
jgi:hypothetical protein